MFTAQALLGGSWVVVNGVMNPLIWIIAILATLFITPLITTHEPEAPNPKLQDSKGRGGLAATTTAFLWITPEPANKRGQ